MVKKSTKFTILFGGLWFLVFVYYPYWLIETDFNTRISIFSIALVLVSIATFTINKYLKKNLDVKEDDIIKEKSVFKWNKVLILLIGLAVILQIYALTFPILTQSDESTHVLRGVYIYEPINKILSNIGIPTQLFSWIVLIIGTFLFLKLKDSQKLKEFIPKHKAALIIFAIMISGIYFFLLSKFADNYVLSQFGSFEVKYFDWLMWYGILAAIFSSIPLFLFGINEIAARMPPIILYALSGIFLFKLVNLYRTKKEAIISVAFLLFFPIYFYWGHVAELPTGEVFFVIASMYYLLKYEKSKQMDDLLIISFLMGAAFTYKENCLYIFIIFNIFWFIKHFLHLGIKDWLDIKNFFEKNKNYIIASIISLVAIIPHLIMMNIYRARPLNITPSNWLDFSKATFYLRILPQQITLAFTIIFAFAFLYCVYKILKKENDLYLIPLIWFSVIYISWTSELYIGHIRFTIPFLPAIAIMCTLFIGDIIKKDKIKNLLFIGLAFYLIFTSVFLTYHNWRDRYPPMDEMFSYIRDNVSEDARILRTMAPNPYRFYIAKYDLPQYFEHNVWTEPDDAKERSTTTITAPPQPTTADKQTVENLYRFSVENNFTYVLFISPQIAFDTYYEINGTWYQTHDFIDSNKPWVTYVNKDVVLQLENMTSDKFILEKQFISGRNKIFLSKVNKTYK